MESRLAAGEALVKVVEAADSKPDVLIQASAAGYYGSTGDALIADSSPPGEDFLTSVTLEWESSTKAVEAIGVRRAVARLGLVLARNPEAIVDNTANQFSPLNHA